MSTVTEAKQWIRVTPVENIPLREGRAVRIAGHEIALFNLGDAFLAVENRCPHRGGPLADGILSGRSVVCPLHAWKVDLASGQVADPPGAQGCIRRFRTRVEEGVVSVEIAVPVSVARGLAAVSGATLLGQISSSEA
jgi:nitrite reductase (NADH) small subunit